MEVKFHRKMKCTLYADIHVFITHIGLNRKWYDCIKMDLTVLEYEDGKWMGAAEDCVK